MVQVRIDAGAIRAALRRVDMAADEGAGSSIAIPALFATIASASADVDVAGAAFAAGKVWACSLADATAALQAVAVGLELAARAYDETELEVHRAFSRQELAH